MIIAVIGATASGKTAKAIQLAQELDGIIINCDRFQLYKDLRILSAYPTDEELATAPHRMFGILDCHRNTSAYEYAKLASDEIKNANRQPIVVGGTGMYLDILVNGISPLPNIPEDVRQTGIELAIRDFPTMCETVYKFDPQLNVRPENHHQIIRAWEILTVTGKSIRYFFEKPRIKFVEDSWKFVYLNPPRDELYAKINKRFDLMIRNGAIDEVSALLKKFDNLPLEILFQKFHIFKTIGVREIAEYLNEVLPYNQMIELVKQHSRNYAKRQNTWFNKHSKLFLKSSHAIMKWISL